MKYKILHVFDHVYAKVIVIILLLIFPLNIIAIKQNAGSMDAMLEQARLTTQNLADNYMSDVNARMENTQSILVHFLQEDVDCIVMREQPEDDYKYESAKMRFYYNLKNIGGLINGADGYFYYMNKKQDMLAWGPPVKGDNILLTMEDFITSHLEKNGSQGWHIYELNSKKYLLLVMKRKNISYGAWMSLEDMENQIQKGIEYPGRSISFSEEAAGETDREMIRVSSEEKGILLNIDIPVQEVTGKLSGYQKIMRALVFIYLMLVPVLYFILRHLFLIPLRKINEAHSQLREGNQDYRLSEAGNSVEFREAFRSFNQMADNINRLKIEGYEKEIARQKMELKNLQLQIRPHFLLNTFNLIYTLIQRKEYSAIQDIVLYLSDYFRYIFRGHKDLELFPKEMDMIKKYIMLTKIRYAGCIDFTCETDPELEFIRVPPLLLHNFVENSIKYGMKKDQILQITLIGEYEDQQVTIYIMDDGNGMDKETLEYERNLLSGQIKPKDPNAHIGLLNSSKRLKYFYGDSACIHVDSEPDKLTCFKIQFPYNLEGQDELTDCE